MSEEGKKFDKGKPRISLISPEFTLGLAQVLTFGADKYGDYNWQEGIAYTRLLDALERHMLQFKLKKDVDDESGMDHLLHAACNIMFLYWMSKHKQKFDDRHD